MRNDKTLSESKIFHFEKQTLRRFYKPGHKSLVISVCGTNLPFPLKIIEYEGKETKTTGSQKKSVNPIKRGDEWV